MNDFIFGVLWYFLGISMVSALITCYDKWAAVHGPKHRTRERTLLLLAALGGSVAMYLTLLCIRHKTKHVRFMLGIPGILIGQILILGGILYITKNV